MKIFLFLTLCICLGYIGIGQNINISTTALYKWNEIGMQAANNIGSGLYPPMPESRMDAMAAIAMYDVVNAISAKSKLFHFETNVAVINMNAEVAIATAAYKIYLHEMPAQNMFLDSVYKLEIGKIMASEAKSDGIDLGNKVAESILQWRSTDLADKAMYPVEPGNKPGEYRFTSPFDGPPFNTPPFKGIYADPGWGKITPFVLNTANQFRPAIEPYKTTDKRYTKEYNEIKNKGCKECPKRSKDQTEFALFWQESSPRGWNRIAVNIAKKQSLNAHALSELLVLLHMAIADSYFASMDGKLHYFYWRPVTAVHLADNDDNPKTASDQNWIDLGFPTPPIPDYPSAHACAGGAAAEILKYYFKTDNLKFSTVSDTYPGVTRSFNSFSQAAKENSDSRVYIGYHFRHATIIGEEVGKKVGRYVVTNFKAN